VIVIFFILFVDVFENAGTLIGVTHRTGLMQNGPLARMKEALISDSFAAIFGALIGTSTTASYTESAAGVAAGGRTGLTAVTVGVLFLLALFFAPLAGAIPAYASAAALLYVICVMARGLAEIDWDDISELRTRGGDRDFDAAHIFDRDGDRPRLHHFCAGEDRLE
jgi:AGZA family xanthine/uracil permease-like MFS transporter